ncbi:hypothetical protein BGZ76_003877 [Entomortierella beljakovae]|nr:hypothetical protein BGZ76_003877 [Entomortierella beljakovae]
MEHIDRTKLYNDPVYRFQYVAKFIGFGEEDIQAIKDSAPLIAPLAPVVVDAVYSKLHSFDITWDIMAKRHEGFTPKGKVIEESSKLSEDSEQIKFRKDMLSRYLGKLLTDPYDEKMIKYLDYVARIHTDTPTKKSKINVEYIHINALLAYVEAALIGGIKTLNLDRDAEYKLIAAFGKLLWIQNDFFGKYYTHEGTDCQPEIETKNKQVEVAPTGFFASIWKFFF